MPSKLFHALIVTGASITGSIGIAVVPAAVTTLSGCDQPNGAGFIVHGAVDAGIVFDDIGALPPDLGSEVGVVDMAPSNPDGFDGGQS